MTTPNPLSSVGLLAHVKGDDAAFLGTCFAFRHPTLFLTAAHCLGELAPTELKITLPHVNQSFPLKVVTKHSTADLAVLILDVVDPPPIHPFTSLGAHSWGVGFRAFGYPEDVFGTAPTPTARLFYGHIQREMSHTSHLGYTYAAAEMSIGAPAGLSGGPLFREEHPLIIGVVTESLQSTTFLQAVEEIQKEGVTYKESVHQVINYGVALLLEPLEEFISQYVPSAKP